MPTSLHSVTGDWAQVIAGPQESVSIQLVSGSIYYSVSTATPPSNDAGHFLQAGVEGHTISLAANENLYARSLGGTAQLSYTV